MPPRIPRLALAALLLLPLLALPSAWGRALAADPATVTTGTVETGNYFHGVRPDDGVPDNAGGLIPFTSGELFDHDLSQNVGWRGRADAPKTVAVVFDLLRDVPLESITLLSNAPNQYWGFDEATVTYRSEAATTYSVAQVATRARTELNYRLTVPMHDRSARFVRIELLRRNQYLHIPLTEIELRQGTGTPGADPAPPLTAEQMRAELARYTRLVDRYGQYLYQDWPGKITSDQQLRDDAAREAAHLATVEWDRSRYDRYGGLRQLGNHRATGYFRLEKVDGRWWFVTPQGHLFFLKGVDAVSDQEWGYGTVYRNPDGSARDVFAELPDPDAYAPAYGTSRYGDVVSLLRANLMRKYGPDYQEAWREVTRRRLIDWGFNAFSKWTRDPAIEAPYIEQVTVPPDAVRILWAPDPFDPEWQAKLDRHVDVTALRHDPWLIGYFFDNERGWNRDVVAEALRRDGTLPAKRAFSAYLADAYGGDIARVNAVLGTAASSFEELTATPVDVARVPAADLSAFITLASEEYYAGIRQAIRADDPNHLFLGSALVPGWRSSTEWIVGGRAHLDAISLDVYSDNAGYLAQFEPYDKPVLNLEYSFNCAGRGLRAINAAVSCADIADRGEKYRAFLQAQAASPVFVGSGWFVYYDQAVTGRPGDGENYNFGLVNQQDQPYTEMTDIMRDTNRTIEFAHLGGASG
ncbi:hypothetical protein [Allostreptomyces psammosilenae]|uniref:F5/8 type C domain-containing protein n=1 Tax=Allostreptomyces psammosilenae TaxID=1892865 RepID=A0A853A079_9ACTN|nr:hypothetical protein [Allostreptomyces psammosilenae]NYI03922.1 hypothetical protein [Allostreptomyces psammosilenae]